METFIITKRDGTKLTVIVDNEDAIPVLQEGKWYSIRNTKQENSPVYIYRMVDRKSILLHRFILALHGQVFEQGDEVDHINGNGLDNRKENLRVVNRQKNSCNKEKYSTNKSGFKGVSKIKNTNLYRATITVNYKHITLGTSKDPEEAYKMYLAGVEKYHGEYGRKLV